MLILRLRAEKNVISSLGLDIDDLRVALVLREIRMRAEDRVRKLFHAPVIVKLDGAGVGNPRPVGLPVIARIEKIQRVIPGERGAGIGALVILVGIRADTDALVPPVDKVAGCGMVPVFQPVDSAPGTPLVKEMPDPVVVNKAVRVVEKPGNGLNVKGLAVRGVADKLVQRSDLLR